MTSESGFFKDIHLSGWKWWIIFLLGLAASIFGIIGVWIYEFQQHQHVDPGNVFYQTLQMFILHTPHFTPPVNWYMEIARWMAAAVFLIALVIAIFKIFHDEVRLFGLNFYRNHVIICGLGKIGLRLAYQFFHLGQHVVAIEDSSQIESIRKAHKLGIPVIIGDARKDKTLMRAKFKRAKHIFTVCSDENTNITIAINLAAMFTIPVKKNLLCKKKLPISKTKCWMFIKDPKLRSELECNKTFTNPCESFEVNVKGLNIFAVSARKALATYYLDHRPITASSKDEVLLIIAGFHQMGEALALQALKIGHYANQRPINIAIVDSDGENRWNDFARRYSVDDTFCNCYSCIPIQHDDPIYFDKLSGLCTSTDAAQKIVTYAICYEENGLKDEGQIANDNLNLVISLRLARIIKDKKPRILTYLNRNRGMAEILHANQDCQNPGVPVIPFGMLEDATLIETLMNEEQDKLAQIHHAVYLNSQKKTYLKKQMQFPDPEKPGHKTWEELNESYRESNREAADHIPVKIRCLGYQILNLGSKETIITDFSRAEIEILSIMEHNRWMAEKKITGWKKGFPRDEINLIHPALEPWSKLDPDIQYIDEELIKGISECLKNIGKGIYCMKQKAME